MWTSTQLLETQYGGNTSPDPNKPKIEVRLPTVSRRIRRLSERVRRNQMAAGASRSRSGSSWWTRDALEVCWRFSWDASSLWSSDARRGGEPSCSLVSSRRTVGVVSWPSWWGPGCRRSAWEPPCNPRPGWASVVIGPS